ncbi:Hypothetical protein CINCED_3A021766 [Cinara cedri]|uniref:Uncharacterized protein n=1 Tax=Cinara cedri TaxID=506608 RepID=A0A5E4LZT9_9HEMI|nr:Hypothetical protein CINCED_3A021766 [Cinara cedri]
MKPIAATGLDILQHANPEDRNIIKQYVIDRVHFHFYQNKNLSSLSSSNLETNSEDEDDFFNFSVVNSDFKTLVTNYLSNTNIKVIKQVNNVGLHVIAIISDQGRANEGAIKILKTDTKAY